MNNILIPTKSAEDWKAFLAEPDKQWKSGFSAKSLAYCWEEAYGFPNCIKTVFSEAGAPFTDLNPLLIIPELQVPLLGAFVRGYLHQDLVFSPPDLSAVRTGKTENQIGFSIICRYN